jgi:trimethylamine--corrinoid protein Co-methyltransferase
LLRARIQVLSEGDREEIHNAGLEIAERVGIRVDNANLRGLLEKKGCKVDDASAVVHIPKALARESYASVGRKPVLKCVSGKELHCYGGNRYYGSLILDPIIVDYKEGPRPPRLSDVERHAKLGDALPLVDSIYKMEHTLTDVPDDLSEIKGLQVFMSNQTASYSTAPSNMATARLWVEMSEIMAGGSLRDNPILCGYVATVSPLIFPDECAKMLRYFLERKVVMRCGPCPIAGGTSPYTLAGTLALTEAENAFFVTAHQALAPGAPMFYAAGAHCLDMASGNFSYCGPTKDILHLAYIEMAEEYHGIPWFGGTFATHVSKYDYQNGLETVMGAAYSVLSSATVIHGMGSNANASGMSAEQILLHHELVERIGRYMRGVDVTEEKLAVESIAAQGPGGNFLTDDLTLKYMRSGEHYEGRLLLPFAPGKDTQLALDRAHARVEEIIASHKPAVPEDRVAELNRYVEEKEREMRG